MLQYVVLITSSTAGLRHGNRNIGRFGHGQMVGWMHADIFVLIHTGRMHHMHVLVVTILYRGLGGVVRVNMSTTWGRNAVVQYVSRCWLWISIHMSSYRTVAFTIIWNRIAQNGIRPTHNRIRPTHHHILVVFGVIVASIGRGNAVTSNRHLRVTFPADGRVFIKTDRRTTQDFIDRLITRITANGGAIQGGRSSHGAVTTIVLLWSFLCELVILVIRQQRSGASSWGRWRASWSRDVIETLRGRLDGNCTAIAMEHKSINNIFLKTTKQSQSSTKYGNPDKLYSEYLEVQGGIKINTWGKVYTNYFSTSGIVYTCIHWTLASTNQPTIHQPTNNQPTINQPTINQPTINQPTNHQPTNHQPTNHQPTNQPTINQPTINQPSTNQPSTNQPSTISVCVRVCTLNKLNLNWRRNLPPPLFTSFLRT